MKILLATDGSYHSDVAIKEITSRPWPDGSQVKILTVIHPAIPEIPDPLFLMYSAHEEQLEEARKVAPQIVEKAARKIRDHSSHLQVSTQILEGSPKHLIVEEATDWGADLILLGSHGYGPVGRFLLGSVSHALALHAPCSVEIVRAKEPGSEP